MKSIFSFGLNVLSTILCTPNVCNLVIGVTRYISVNSFVFYVIVSSF